MISVEVRRHIVSWAAKELTRGKELAGDHNPSVWRSFHLERMIAARKLTRGASEHVCVRNPTCNINTSKDTITISFHVITLASASSTHTPHSTIHRFSSISTYIFLFPLDILTLHDNSAIADVRGRDTIIHTIITMKFSPYAMAAVLVAGASPVVESFSIQSSLSRVRLISTPHYRQMAATSPEKSNEYDFDSILGEGLSYRDSASALKNAVVSSSSSTPVIRVPDGSPAATVTLASSTAVVSSSDIYGDDLSLEGEAMMEAEEEAEVNVNPLLNNEILKRQHEKKLKREERRASGDSGMMRYVKNPLLLVKGKDFSDITITILIPAFVSYLALKKLSEIGFGKLGEKADDLYEKAAKDITYHVGDFDAMESTYKDYKKKLWFNGAPSYINSQLVKRLAVAYTTNISISPKSISSLAYLLTMLKISDDEAADTFVLACRENPKSMAIAAKVLFYSEHVFKDKSAKKKMAPLIKQLSTMFGGMEPVMQQQK